MWKNLRDYFKRCNERRGKATRSGAAASMLPTCKFLKNLKFLKDSVNAKETVAYIDFNDDGNDVDLNVSEQIQMTAIEPLYAEQTQKNKTKKRKSSIGYTDC